ncbi:MAG TPA: hypothetical protein ENG87_02790 [Candidatus Pacearchaeota archaeon]|nr:hypothetical protein [Candidatus Pacearchaeota archaeon]
MAKIQRTLSVEKKLASQESRRDSEVLTSIAKELPSASRVKIYKKGEEFGKSYIASVSAEDFAESDPHEFVKKKYVSKFGGGEYIVDLLDSDGNSVDKKTISIIDESTKSEDVEEKKHVKIMEEALEMREDAFDKVKEAAKEKSEAEKMKYETMMQTLNKNWETMQKMYEAQIAALADQKNDAPDKTQEILIQMQIDKINRDFEKERDKYEQQLREKEEGKMSTDKMFDLVNSLIPMLIEKTVGSQKDPIEELNKTISLVNTVTGGKKDMIESFLENPDRMAMFQKLLGIEHSNGKKNMFEDMLENPAKADMFKKLLGIEEKKDFITEMIENPAKFDIFKKVMGLDSQERMMKDVVDAIKHKNDSVPVEPPKHFLDELADAKSKFDTVKTLFNPPQPAKTFMEFLSTLVTGAGPHISNAVNSFMQGQITIEMIRKGLIKKGEVALPSTPAVPSIAPNGYNGIGHTTENVVQQENKEEEASMNIEEEFTKQVIGVIKENPNGIQTDFFIDKTTENIVKHVRKHPLLILQIMKYTEEEIAVKMSVIIASLMQLEKAVADELSKTIIENVVIKIKSA